MNNQALMAWAGFNLTLTAAWVLMLFLLVRNPTERNARMAIAMVSWPLGRKYAAVNGVMLGILVNLFNATLAVAIFH